MSVSPQFLDGPHGRLAYRLQRASQPGAPGLVRPGPDQPGVVWLGGFRSDMLGTKAEYLNEWARAANRTYLRFDYSGHGESEGAFEDGCIGQWADDANTILSELTEGPQVLVGSSMGGWIATLLALRHHEKVAAIVYIAPAPDFTEKLMWPSFTDEQRSDIERKGRLELPSAYSDEPEIITRKLIEDGRRHLVMSGDIAISAPVRILQGMKDDAVPYAHALAFAAQLASADIEITLTPSGDHRLSTPADLQRLATVLNRL